MVRAGPLETPGKIHHIYHIIGTFLFPIYFLAHR